MKATRISVLTFAAALVGAQIPAPAAFAGQGTSTTYLNVRSGPGSGNAVVGGLNPGDVVEILRCDADAWCQIAGVGMEGWVASRYLTAGPEYPAVNPGCTWSLDVTLPEPQFRATCPPGVEPPPPPPPPGDIACFFAEPSFGGTRTCLDVGDFARLDPDLSGTFSSVQISGEARVRLCTEPDLGGVCMDWMESTLALDPRLDDSAMSAKVYVGYLPPPPPPPPVVHSEGSVELTLNGRADLDQGDSGAAGADIWWRPQGGDSQVIVPVNGAQMSLADGSDRSLHDCRAERFDATPIDAASLTDGAVVCLKTNLGRVARFLVATEGGSALTLDYVTWAEQ
ncbi:SH3 domain-containing protein [Psychromarinibacter halotolerans]|uniref:SH3 domain-containing protein n=1 Tax=Psychromarinibacter halotolerans TaxID=1775175 RepID=A0ABV7GZW3_9RHOB|nr:SH3 domain-containing protein [Psychromarinibacter halotolerans]MDF0598593.1 SH3 domain-containing protein [Psychromarinibacter halotolerans]